MPSDYLYPPVARMLLMLLFMIVFAVYLRTELPHVYRDNPMLAVFALLTLVVMGSAELQVGRARAVRVHRAAGARAARRRVAAREAPGADVHDGAHRRGDVGERAARAPFVPVAAMGGVTAVYSVARLRHRWHFALAFVTIALANVAAILAWDLARATSITRCALDIGFGRDQRLSVDRASPS